VEPHAGQSRAAANRCDVGAHPCGGGAERISHSGFADGLWRLWTGAVYCRDGRLATGQDCRAAYQRAPSNARTGAAWAVASGVHYLDGAILAQPSFIGTDYATVFYAGDRAIFDAHKATLQALANNTVFVADAIRSAAALDCAILEAYYGGCLAFLHAAAICESEGISASRFFDYKQAFVSAIDVTVDVAMPMLEQHRYTGDQCSLDTHVGALAHTHR